MIFWLTKKQRKAFTDSNGDFHGKGFGKVMTNYSNKVRKTGEARNKLHALEKKHRKKGNQAKADRIKNNNLGRIKCEKRQDKTKKQLRTIAFKAAHSIVDKANVIVAEDLMSPIVKKRPWKTFNRHMSSWAKGILSEALESVSQQRKAHLERSIVPTHRKWTPLTAYCKVSVLGIDFTVQTGMLCKLTTTLLGTY